jgi:hypothetical protein
MDLCFSWWNVCLYRTCRYGREKYVNILLKFLFYIKVPELVSMGDEIEKDYFLSKRSVTIFFKLKILLCQNSGVILGVAIMFLLGKYGTYLENLVQL